MNTTTLSQFLAQSRVAEREIAKVVEAAEREGYVQEAPGVWIKRDAAGQVVATMEF